MENQELIKRLKVVAIALVAVLVFAAQAQQSRGATQNQPGRLFEIVGVDTPLEQRVGVDDGAVFAVHFGGDTRGVLDVCG